jgi:hypothetical protein
MILTDKDINKIKLIIIRPIGELIYYINDVGEIHCYISSKESEQKIKNIINSFVTMNVSVNLKLSTLGRLIR